MKLITFLVFACLSFGAIANEVHNIHARTKILKALNIKLDTTNSFVLELPGTFKDRNGKISDCEVVVKNEGLNTNSPKLVISIGSTRAKIMNSSSVNELDSSNYRVISKHSTKVLNKTVINSIDIRNDLTVILKVGVEGKPNYKYGKCSLN